MFIKINKSEYLKEVVEKTVYSFEKKHGMYLVLDDYNYNIYTNGSILDESLFFDELAKSDLRFQISKQTATIKKLIVGRALYETCIKVD